MDIIDLSDAQKFVEAKKFIESALHDENSAYKEKSTPEFIDMLNMKNSIFVKDDYVVPFRIIKDKIFIVGDETSIKYASSALQEIKYNLNVLIEIPIEKVHTGRLDRYEYYFIIDSKYMVFEK